ncbi:MAG: RDD family protein [Pyrinomonadaceae bacterium]|nr:RDD family protein [Sphingobacteriaceae bacterium]
MSKRTDEELIEILTIRKDDYQPLALEAAQLEIEKRGIADETIKQVEIQRNEEIEEQYFFYSNKANRTIRFVNSIIDFICLLLLFFALTLLLQFFVQTETEQGATFVAYSLFIIVFFAYYIILEFYFQKTIGKFLTKTTVITIAGNAPTLGDITTRTFCRLIPFDRLSFLFARNGFYDSFSKTTVVRDARE